MTGNQEQDIINDHIDNKKECIILDQPKIQTRKKFLSVALKALGGGFAITLGSMREAHANAGDCTTTGENNNCGGLLTGYVSNLCSVSGTYANSCTVTSTNNCAPILWGTNTCSQTNGNYCGGGASNTCTRNLCSGGSSNKCDFNGSDNSCSTNNLCNTSGSNSCKAAGSTHICSATNSCTAADSNVCYQGATFTCSINNSCSYDNGATANRAIY